MDFKNNLNSFFANFELLNPLLQAAELNQIVNTKSLIGSLKTFAAIKVFEKGHSVFLPFEDFTSAKRLKAELELLGYEDSSVLFSFEKLDLHSPSIEEVLQKLSQKNNIVVTTYSSLFQPILTKEEFQKNNISLSLYNTISYDDIIDMLDSLDYQRQNFVEERGDYAVRGSLVDIFSFSHSSPVRIEFDGDKIHSMRLFDPDNQRSFSFVNDYSIYTTANEKSNSANSTLIDFAENSVIILGEYDFTKYKDQQISSSSKLIIENEFFSENLIQIEAKNLPQINSNLEILQAEINKLTGRNYRVDRKSVV